MPEITGRSMEGARHNVMNDRCGLVRGSFQRASRLRFSLRQAERFGLAQPTLSERRGET